MRFEDEKGFTLVELLVVMALMAILGTMIINFMINGSHLYKKTYTDYDSRSDARLAVHYIVCEIRNNDIEDCIRVVDNKITLIKKSKTRANVIYFEDNQLKVAENKAIDKDTQTVISKEPSKRIANITSFEATGDGKAITIKVGYKDSSNVEKIYKETVALRSAD